LFKSRKSGDSPSQQSALGKPKPRTRQDLLQNLSEIAVPPPIEHRDGVNFCHHHTLEENLSRNLSGDEEDEFDVLARHLTMDEANTDLSKRLSKEVTRQTEEIRHLSEEVRRLSQELSRRSEKEARSPGQ